MAGNPKGQNESIKRTEPRPPSASFPTPAPDAVHTSTW